MKNKWFNISTVMMLFFCLTSVSLPKKASADTPEVQNVNISDLSKEQREAIQSGQPTPGDSGKRTLFVYELDPGKCPIGETLPNTGSVSNTIFLIIGIVSLSGAGYFIVSDKKAKKMIMMLGLISAGAIATTSTISALTDYEQSLINMGCYRYVGYIREAATTTTAETTVSTTTTEATTETIVTTNEIRTTGETTMTTVERTTSETTTAETTTESEATETPEPITVAPTDHL